MKSIGWTSSLSNLIPHALDALESVAGSKNLDVMETSITPEAVRFGLGASALVLSSFSPYPISTFAVSSLGMLFIASRYDRVQAKKTLAEKRIAQIGSLSCGKPKRALIIQSPKDKYGALSMRSHIEKVRELAKTHTIVRVLVSDENKFLKYLPPGRFDTVWIRAHGTPTTIKMGHGFELSKSSRPEIFHTLASKLKRGGKLILECCNTAYADPVNGNIAEHIASYSWNATVYAPLTKISGSCGLAFDKWGCPQFNDNDGFSFKGRAVTRVIDGPISKYQKVQGYIEAREPAWIRDTRNRYVGKIAGAASGLYTFSRPAINRVMPKRLEQALSSSYTAAFKKLSDYAESL
jgi:hypothetical protein